MSRINQEHLFTVSPTIGPYWITTDVQVDSGYTGVFWGGGTGVIGDVNPGTLLEYGRDQGLTGISGTNFTNIKNGTYR